MARYGSSDVAFLLIGGYDLLGVTTEIEHKVERLTDETTVLGIIWPTHDLVGMRKASFSQKGFYDDATNSSNTALKALAGTDRVLMFGLETNALGKSFIGSAGLLQADYERITQLAKLHRANAMYQVDGAVENGLIVVPLQTVTASGDTLAAPVDNGAATTAGGAAYSEITAINLDGATYVEIRLRHSADNVVYVPFSTHQAASAPDARREAVAGTINRYVAATWVWVGGGANKSVTFAVGLARG